MTAPTSGVPTPLDVAVQLGLTDGSWTAENLEELRAAAPSGGPLAEAVDAAAQAATPDTAMQEPSAEPVVRAERSPSWSEREAAQLLDRAQAAMEDAESAARANERWLATSRRVEAGLLVAMATARSVGQVASAGHRCASALHDVAAAVRQRGAR